MITKKMNLFFGLALLGLIMTVAVAPVAAHIKAQAFKVDLIAGQHTDVGDIWVYGDYQHVYIKINNMGNWKITELHIDVAETCDEIPQTRTGNPIPGKFDYKRTFNPAVSGIEWIELDLQGYTSENTICIAVHAVVIQTCGGRILNQETAWGQGHDFPGANWGMCFI